jgi:hypothetical protein
MYTAQYWWILSDNLKWLWFLPMLWSMYTICCNLYYIGHSDNLKWLWFLPMLSSMYTICCNLYYIYSYTLTDSMSAKMYMEGKINININVPTVLKSGSLNLLEPSGPVKACNGIALLLLCLPNLVKLTVQFLKGHNVCKWTDTRNSLSEMRTRYLVG